MGTSTSARQLAGKLVRAGQAVEQSKRIGIQAEASVVKNALLAAGTAAGIGPTLSGVSRGNGRVGVRSKMQGDDALVAWYGPAHLVNNNTRPHMIQPLGFIGTRSVGAKAQKSAALLALFGVDARLGGALELKDGRIRSRVRHPGTRGKQFFQAGREVAERVGPPVYQSVMHRSLINVFR